MHGLTERQQAVLTAIRRCIDERGYPPTLRELGASLGIRSTNAVNDHLRALERKGFLTRAGKKSRGLRLGGSAPNALAPAPLTEAELDQAEHAEATPALVKGLLGEIRRLRARETFLERLLVEVRRGRDLERGPGAEPAAVGAA